MAGLDGFLHLVREAGKHIELGALFHLSHGDREVAVTRLFRGLLIHDESSDLRGALPLPRYDFEVPTRHLMRLVRLGKGGHLPFEEWPSDHEDSPGGGSEHQITHGHF